MKETKTGWGIYILAGLILYPLFGSQQMPAKFTTWGLPIFILAAIVAGYLYKKLKNKITFIKNDVLKGLIVGIPLWFVFSMGAAFLPGILTGLTN